MILLFHADNKPQILRLIIRKTVYLQKTVMPMYIHEHKEWPSFSWDKELVGEKLNKVNKAVGYLMGRLSVIGFNDKMSAVVESISHDIIASSEIEGVELNNEQVRSSVARKLGVQLPNPTESSRYIDGVVEMALDATVNFNSPLTHERLFGWHNCLFPTGWSGPTKIDVARYRSGEMKVISGMFGREKVHYVAPAPGNTCLTACFNLMHCRKVENNSKGCGGIMRVAPLALLLAGDMSRYGKCPYSIPEMFEAGAHIARVTHLHPLGFLPAGMLTEFLFKLVPLSLEEAKDRITDIAEDTINTLDKVFVNQFAEDKCYLAELTRKAIRLAHSSTPDYRAIEELGEGWTAEETWAISLFCTIRHIDSIHDAIVASVNHNGDSDSTGSVTGNIMGAIYGYEEIKHQRLFCPGYKEFQDTIELADIILALADDLTTGCIISEYAPIDTPAKKQWFERYCEMLPSGL